MRPNLERLDERRVMATDWQNPIVPFDIDSTGTVQATDVLLLVHDLKTKGARLLGQRPQGSTDPLCDVNGDGRMTAQDVLLTADGLKLYTKNSLTISIAMDANSDSNGNEVVQTSLVTYLGTTLPYTHVRVESLDEVAGIASQVIVSDRDGKFQLQLDLGQSINHLKFTANDPRGRTKTTERIVRHGDVIAEWNAELLEAIRETTAPSSVVPGLLIKPPPPLVAKQLAMLHAAMFDAINAIDPQYESYALDLDTLGVATPEAASEIAAAATAAHLVASALYSLPFHIAKWDLTLTESLRQVPDGVAKTLGIEIGTKAANAILALRANDGSSSTSNYVTQEDVPGRWEPTAPDFGPPILPQWPHVTPFVMSSGDEFRPAAIPALNSAEYAAAVDEVMRLGSANSTQRTADQTAIALFWADGGGTVTPPGHWNSIAMDIALTRASSLIESARSMALVNLALADAGIAGWDAKYVYDVWRPIDAIREADTDGNASTIADTNWAPLLSTPSFPSYVSGHSTFSGAAAAVLTALYGNNVAFTSRADKGSTGLWPPSSDVSGLAVRSFSSFEAAAAEAGMSRIYGGIHFNFDNTAGLATGNSIGNLVVTAALQPLN